MNEVIEVFKKNNLIRRNKPIYSSINSLSFTKFVDINKELAEIIKRHHEPVNSSLASFAAEPNLGGSDLECKEISCRMERIDKLARYALLYSDEVYIESYFNKYLSLENKKYYTLYKNLFYEDLLVFNYIIPLLEKGIIKLYSPNTAICFACQAKELMGEEGQKKFIITQRKLRKDICETVKVSCELSDNEYYYDYNGAEKYFEHGLATIEPDADDLLIKRKKIFEKIQKGAKVQLSNTLTKELGFYEDIAHTFIKNVLFGLSTSYSLNTAYLTSSEIGRASCRERV